MRRTLRDDVAAYFKARPNTWIDGMAIARIGGCYASRTRISDCRTQLGMTIENRQRYERDHEPHCPGIQAWDIPEACDCGRPVRRTISEYRFVPADLLELAEAS